LPKDEVEEKSAMPTYIYKARDGTGKQVKGAMDASSKDELIAKLSKMGFMTTQAKEVLPGFKLESLFNRFKPVGTDDMIMFYVQFSNMINAGIPLLTTLDTLSKQTENTKLREAVGSVARNVEAGDSFSQALLKYPRIFPKLFANMIKAGEASGTLDKVSARYASYFEHQEELRQKISNALFYPAILLTAGVGVTLFMVTFVIPKFADIFMKAGITLPTPTLILFASGVAIKRFWYLGILFILLCYLGFKYYAKTERGRLSIDRLKLNIPILGSLYRKAAISGFAKTLGTLSGSGVPILESLDITRDVIGNEVLARVISNTRTAVEKGEKMSEVIKISGEFPPDIVQMISVGEESGNLDEMLDKIAEFYDMMIGYVIKKLTTALEPIFLVIMGALVGFIMISVLLPMFDMIKILK